MPQTVEFVFLFFKCCFILLLHALDVAANCVKRRKIDLNNNYYLIILFEIQNTNTLFIETRTRVKQLNEFNAVK